MAVDRRHGKGAKLVIALFLLGTATVALAFLPGYDTIGVAAIWLLAAARVLQGIAWGGAWDGLASLLAMNSPANRRGWYAMVPQLGAPLGLIVASALFAFFAGNLSADDFFDWGWRYPFFVAFAINVVALFARLRMVATDEYSELFESRDLEPARVGARPWRRRAATSCSAPLRRWRALRCSTWSRCFRCPGCSCSPGKARCAS
ncbi:MFS transporter [Bradyrhizobium sp. JR3.5]